MINSKTSNINFIIILLAFIILLLTVSNRMLFSFQTQTGVFLLLTVSSLFLLNNYKIKLSSYIIPSVLIFITAVISYFFADYQVNVGSHILIIISALLAGFNVTFLSLKSKRNLFFIPIFIGLFLSIVLFSKFLANPAGLFDPNINFCTYSGLNPDITASFLIMIFPLIFTFIYDKVNIKVYIAAAFFILCAIIITKAHFAVIISLTETIIIMFLFFKKKNNIALFFCLFFLFAIILYIYFNKPFFCISLQQKLQWKTAYLIFKDNIFFGCGFGNYSALFESFRPEFIHKSYYAENIIFQFLAEAGLSGLLFFVLFLCSFYIKVIKEIILNKNNFFHKAVIISASAFLIINLINGSFFVPVNMTLFFIVMCSVFNADAVKTDKPKISPYITNLFFIIIFIFIVMPVISDVYYKKGINYYVLKQYNLSAESFETAIKFDRKNPVYYHQLSKANFAMFDIKRDSENSNIYIDKAEDCTLKAISLYKNETSFRQSLAYIYINKNEKDKAVQVLEEAEKYDKFNTDLSEMKYEFINL